MVLLFLSVVAPQDDNIPIAAFVLVWPVVRWSTLGTREGRYCTGSLVFSSAYPLRQLGVVWLAGAILALLASSGLMLRLLLGGSSAQAAVLMTGALFIPALALCLGVWSGTDRLFQVVYLLWWYTAVSGKTELNFMGTTPETVIAGNSPRYLILAAGLLLVAFVGRWRQDK